MPRILCRGSGSLPMGLSSAAPNCASISRRSLAISRFHFFDQLLKLRIVAQGIPHRIDTQQRRSQWSECEPAQVMGAEKFWQSGYCASCSPV